MRTAAKTTVATVLLWLCYSGDPARGATESRHDHVRTKSSLARPPMTDALTAGMPAAAAIPVAGSGEITDSAGVSGEVTVVGGGGGNGSGGKSGDVGVFHDLLVRQPSKILRKLMRTGVDVVQRGMDAYQSATSKVYDVARTTIGRPRVINASTTASTAASTAASTTADAGPQPSASSAAASDEGSHRLQDNAAGSSGGESSKRARSRRRALKAPPTDQAKTNGLGNTVIDLLDTGIGGIEQMTDLGLLLGNIGTHKIRAKLDGQSGNKEILKLLIKYVGSRAGIGAKGSPVQMIDDVGTISTFVANDDEVTTMISTVMERVMNDTEVSKAMVRLAITVLDGNPSTQCVLDKLPLAPADLRMLFDVFVGSNGQVMMKTIAGLLSDLTTGPDTKAFLESALGMASMFKSSSSTPTNTEKPPEKPKSFFGSLTGLFTGGDTDIDDDAVNETVAVKPVPPPPVPKRPSPRRPSINNNNNNNNNNKKGDSWFGFGFNDDKTVSKPDSNKPIQPEEDVWFSEDSETSVVPAPIVGSRTKPKPVVKKPVKRDENSRGTDKNNINDKNITKPGGNKPRNINVVDDGGGSKANGNRVKRKTTRPQKQAKTNGRSDVGDSANDNSWFNDEKNEKIKQTKTSGTVARY